MQVDDPPSPLVSYLLPVYNEELRLASVLDRLDLVPVAKQVIVVDDGSTDRTPKILDVYRRERQIEVVTLNRNGGKGAALREGLVLVSGKVVVIQDADLEYDPLDTVELIEPILTGRADAVFGSRSRGGKPQLVWPLWNMVGDWTLSTLTRLLFNTSLSDMPTGYKAFEVELMRSLELESEGFDIEVELTVKTLVSGARLCEVPISYYRRSPAEGKKFGWVDGFHLAGKLLEWRVRTL